MTDSVPEWTSFCFPISEYTDGDSAIITMTSFFNDTTREEPAGPFGNSVLFVDNISFDSLVSTSVNQIVNPVDLKIYPNPGKDVVHIEYPAHLKGLTLTVVKHCRTSC